MPDLAVWYVLEQNVLRSPEGGFGHLIGMPGGEQGGQSPLVGEVALDLFPDRRIERASIGNHLRNVTCKVSADLVKGGRRDRVGARRLGLSVDEKGVVSGRHLPSH